MKKGQEGRIVIGKKIYSISYANDVTLIAEIETEMRSMMKRFKKYIEKKGLELNVEKSKVMACRKRGGRRMKEKFT